MRFLVDVGELFNIEKDSSIFWYKPKSDSPNMLIIDLIKEVLQSINYFHQFSETDYTIFLNRNILPYWTSSSILANDDLLKICRSNPYNRDFLSRFIPRVVQPLKEVDQLSHQPPQTFCISSMKRKKIEMSTGIHSEETNNSPQLSKPPQKRQKHKKCSQTNYSASTKQSDQSQNTQSSTHVSYKESVSNRQQTKNSVEDSSSSSSSSSVVATKSAPQKTLKTPTRRTKTNGLNNSKHIIFDSDGETDLPPNMHVESPVVSDLVRPKRTPTKATVVDMDGLPFVPVFDRFTGENGGTEYSETVRPTARNESVILKGTARSRRNHVNGGKQIKSLISMPSVGSTVQFSVVGVKMQVAEVDENLVAVISGPRTGVVLGTDFDNQLIDFGLIEEDNVANMITVRLDSLINAKIL